MAVVVTGAGGFLGAAVSAQLLRAGQRVTGIDRVTGPRRAGLRTIQADLCDEEPAVRAALRTADAVIHLAGCPGVRDHRPDVADHRRRDNVEATRAVLRATPEPVPLVVASSSSVYGGARFGRASREEDPVHPIGGYAISKVEVERLCGGRVTAGWPTVVARPFTVVGEGQRSDMALARWLSAARAGRPLRVLGSLERTRDFTDVREVAAALTALVGARGVVNVGTGRPRTLGEAIDAVAATIGTDPVVDLVCAGAEEVRDTWADPTRLTALTGLQPRTDLTDVVARMAACQRVGEAA